MIESNQLHHSNIRRTGITNLNDRSLMDNSAIFAGGTRDSGQQQSEYFATEDPTENGSLNRNATMMHRIMETSNENSMDQMNFDQDNAGYGQQYYGQGYSALNNPKSLTSDAHGMFVMGR